jgi:hypothetical protein
MVLLSSQRFSLLSAPLVSHVQEGHEYTCSSLAGLDLFRCVAQIQALLQFSLFVTDQLLIEITYIVGSALHQISRQSKVSGQMLI